MTQLHDRHWFPFSNVSPTRAWWCFHGHLALSRCPWSIALYSRKRPFPQQAVHSPGPRLRSTQSRTDAVSRYSRAAHDPALNVSAPLNSALLSSAPHVSAPLPATAALQEYRGLLSDTWQSYTFASRLLNIPMCELQAMVAAFAFENSSQSNVLRNVKNRRD